MPTAEEAGPSRADGTDHEYSCMHEPIVPHTVVPFKRTLLKGIMNRLTAKQAERHGSRLLVEAPNYRINELPPYRD